MLRQRACGGAESPRPCRVGALPTPAARVPVRLDSDARRACDGVGLSASGSAGGDFRRLPFFAGASACGARQAQRAKDRGESVCNLGTAQRLSTRQCGQPSCAPAGAGTTLGLSFKTLLCPLTGA